MNYFKLLFILFSTSSQLFGIMYEDAEDKQNNRWEWLDASSFGMVENVYDKTKQSRVIQLKGEGTKSAYKLMMSNNLIGDKKILSWQMRYREDFVIIVGMDTEGGKRYLIYTPSNEDGYMQYGLGKNTRSGVWQTFSRNLQEDLDQFEELNEIKRVHTFVIRGSGSIDNVEILKKLKLKNSEKTDNKNLKISFKNNINTMPNIHILGANPMHLQKGEAFVDPGATAYDTEDGKLQLISSEEIDINKEGKYTVMYIATNSRGNTAVDTRCVQVGEALYNEAYRGSRKGEEKGVEITERIKELKVREKKIIKREYHMQNFSKFQTGQL